MAVCNLFNELKSTSGNFLMFSQYVEDITRNYVEDNNHKVIPTKFVAMNIDYTRIDTGLVLNNGNHDLNEGIPKYFQNCFENACAYARNGKYTNFTGEEWTADISKNLFWNYMFDAGFCHAEQYGSDTGNIKYVPEIVYQGDINMHSYNEHQGMGYGEIYCYIPSDAERKRIQVECFTDTGASRVYDDSNINSIYLEGFNGQLQHAVSGYPQKYYYNNDYNVLLDIASGRKALINDSNASKYDVNTIVVLYSIYSRSSDDETSDWQIEAANIPMGIYFAGRFVENFKLSNTITKYVSTSYNAGTSYGLRICTRFAVTANGVIMTSSDSTSDHDNVNMCQLMTAMNENLSLMLDVTKTTIDNQQSYKELLSIVKNNRTNVPYVKHINGVDYWFVNGKLVSKVDQGASLAYGYLDDTVIQKRIDNLSDKDLTNDYLYIPDPSGLDAEEIPPAELADALGMYEIMNPMPTE